MFTVYKGFRLWGSVKTPQHWSCQKDTVKGSVISHFTCFAGKQTETAENILCSLGEGGRGGEGVTQRHGAGKLALWMRIKLRYLTSALELLYQKHIRENIQYQVPFVHLQQTK